MTKNADRVAEVIERLERRAQYDSDARLSLLRVRNFIAEAERKTGDGEDIGGTGATILKMEVSPIARLCNSGNLGNEEMQAVDDIATAFHSLAGALLIRPQQLERHDKSHSDHDPTRLVAAQKRYTAWQKHWSPRKARGCLLLNIVIRAVIDEQNLVFIDSELRLRHGTAKRAVVAGLRDYAARAGWADAKLAPKWIETAESVFTLRPL